MMDKIIKIRDNVIAFWKKLTTPKKASIVLVLLSTIFVIFAMVYFTQKTDYAVLFSDLSAEDAGNIVSDLDSQKIGYQLQENGTKILIDKNLVNKYRIQLAVDKKLPNSSQGFEIFDNAGMMSTDEDRKIMYQRAVTGELQRSIETLSGVKAAKVILVIPDKSIFENNDKKASASIVLTLSSQGKITEASIQGIAALTAGAVENLPLENIKIVDEKGQVLSKSLEGENNFGSTEIVNKFQEFKSNYEGQLEKKVVELLEPIYGYERVKVSINTDLDFDSIEKTTVTYADPKTRSETVSATGGTLDTQAIQGGNVNDNVANVVGANGNGNNSYQRSVENELNTETTKLLNAPGVVKRLTASVLLDGTLTEVEQEKINGIIASAIGYDQARGDTLAIQGIKFADTVLDGQNGNNESATNLFAVLFKKENRLILFSLLGGILLAVILIIVLLILGRKNRKEDQELAEYSLEAAPEKVELNELIKIKEGIDPPVAVTMSDINSLNEQDSLDDMITSKESQAKKYAKENPDLAAELIKVWMKDK